MKYIYLFLFMIVLFSCSDEPLIETATFYSQAKNLMNQNKHTSLNVDVSGYSELNSLQAKHIFIKKEGVYFITEQNFTSTKGIFVPREEENINADSNFSLKHLGDNVFFFVENP